MLQPKDKKLNEFVNSYEPSSEYRLSDVRLEIPCSNVAVFHARLLGPKNAKVWTRAWLSNKSTGTIAENVSSQLIAGDEVSLKNNETPELA